MPRTKYNGFNGNFNKDSAFCLIFFKNHSCKTIAAQAEAEMEWPNLLRMKMRRLRLVMPCCRYTRSFFLYPCRSWFLRHVRIQTRSVLPSQCAAISLFFYKSAVMNTVFVIRTKNHMTSSVGLEKPNCSRLFCSSLCWKLKNGNFFDFFLFMYVIQHCFICRPSYSTVSEDAGIESRIVATLALTVRRSNHLARSHPQSARSHPHSAGSHPHLG